MAKIYWTKRAQKDIQEIEDFIAQDSLTYAYQFTDRLIHAAERLARSPRMGAVVPEFERDELREIRVRNYRVVYLLRGQDVVVARVVHGARDLKALAEREPWEEV